VWEGAALHEEEAEREWAERERGGVDRGELAQRENVMLYEQKNHTRAHTHTLNLVVTVDCTSLGHELHRDQL